MGGMAGRQPDMLAAAVQLQPQQSRHRKEGKEGSRPGQKAQQRTWEARPKGRACPRIARRSSQGAPKRATLGPRQLNNMRSFFLS